LGPAEATNQPGGNDPGSSGQIILGDNNTQIIGDNNTITYGGSGGSGGSSGGSESGESGVNNTAGRFETQFSNSLSFAMLLSLGAGRFLW
jgi:hypothetical protein